MPCQGLLVESLSRLVVLPKAVSASSMGPAFCGSEHLVWEMVTIDLGHPVSWVRSRCPSERFKAIDKMLQWHLSVLKAGISPVSLYLLMHSGTFRTSLASHTQQSHKTREIDYYFRNEDTEAFSPFVASQTVCLWFIF